MFGFPSLQKLLVLVAVVAAVWYGFKLISRLQAARDAEAALNEGAPKKRRGAGRWGRKSRLPEADAEAEDMVQCPTCKAFVQARETKSCDRADCPY